MHEDSRQPEHAATADATRTFSHVESTHDSLVGTMLGNYHVLARVGAGAHGTVYRARDVRLDRIVAIKRLHAGTRKRFETEARALGRLSKAPFVVDVFAWGEHEGQPYLAMAYLPESAASLLERRPEGLPVEDALSIACQAAKALQSAHTQGLTHGDVKPANILLEESARDARLSDFGLAALHEEARAAETPLAGSPAYLAPERLEGGAPSVAADIYALGATLYTLLRGQAPAGLPLASHRGDLPESVLDVVAKAMDTDPARRYPSAEAFALALDNALPVELNSPIVEESGPARGRLTMILVAISAVILGTFWLVAVPRQGSEGGGVVLADARTFLNHGDYEAAREEFERYLGDHPDHTEARYGLAYAFLLEGEHAQATREFARLGQAALRTEGQAAVQYMAKGEAARPALEQAATSQPGGYADVLLAMLDMMGGEFDAARNRLGGVGEGNLRFDWQRRQYLQTLGQLHYKEGDFAAAQAVFDELAQDDAAPRRGVAEDYAGLARQQQDREAREEVSQRLMRLAALLDDAPASEVGDTWTSRPLRLWTPPVQADKGFIALETGLADVLPWRVSRALLGNADIPIDPVERDLAAAILAEQELVGQLARADGAVRLGRVLGARLLLDLKVHRVLGEERLTASLVDTETTAWTPVGEYPVARNMNPADWLEILVKDLGRAVASRYPLRGRVQPEGERLLLNIGSEHGVTRGMRFDVRSDAGSSLAMPGVWAEVSADPEADHALVTMHGIDASVMPDGGWYVEAIRETKAAGEATHAAV